MSWDELFILVFPEFKTDIQDEIKIIDLLSSHLKALYNERNVPKSEWKYVTHQMFMRFDGTGTDSLDKQEFWSLITHIGGDMQIKLTKKLFQILFMSVSYVAIFVHLYVL